MCSYGPFCCGGGHQHYVPCVCHPRGLCRPHGCGHRFWNFTILWTPLMDIPNLLHGCESATEAIESNTREYCRNSNVTKPIVDILMLSSSTGCISSVAMEIRIECGELELSDWVNHYSRTKKSYSSFIDVPAPCRRFQVLKITCERFP